MRVYVISYAGNRWTIQFPDSPDGYRLAGEWLGLVFEHLQVGQNPHLGAFSVEAR